MRQRREVQPTQAQQPWQLAKLIEGLVQTLRSCRARTRITHTRTTSTVVVSTHSPEPAAGDEKFHATGEVEDAFKMTHLRMVHFSRDPSTTNQAENARQSASAHHGGSHRPSFIVGGRHGSRSVGNPYFTHTSEALTAKVRVTSRRQNSLR